jgi:hypothetical protein
MPLATNELPLSRCRLLRRVRHARITPACIAIITHRCHGTRPRTGGEYRYCLWRHPVAGISLDRLLSQTCPTTAVITMMPPAKLAIDGASLKQTHTPATASGVSSVLIRAFSVCGNRNGGMLRNPIDDHEAHRLSKIADAATEDARFGDGPTGAPMHSVPSSENRQF